MLIGCSFLTTVCFVGRLSCRKNASLTPPQFTAMTPPYSCSSLLKQSYICRIMWVREQQSKLIVAFTTPDKLVPIKLFRLTFWRCPIEPCLTSICISICIRMAAPQPSSPVWSAERAPLSCWWSLTPTLTGSRTRYRLGYRCCLPDLRSPGRICPQWLPCTYILHLFSELFWVAFASSFFPFVVYSLPLTPPAGVNFTGWTHSPRLRWLETQRRYFFGGDLTRRCISIVFVVFPAFYVQSNSFLSSAP